MAVKTYDLTPTQKVEHFYKDYLIKPRTFDEPGSVVSEYDYTNFFFCEEIGFFVDSRYVWLVKEIKLELDDPNYEGCSHGRRATRNRGCVGPLCRYSLRLWRRNQLARTALEQRGTHRAYTQKPEMEDEDQICSVFTGLGIGFKF